MGRRPCWVTVGCRVTDGPFMEFQFDNEQNDKLIPIMTVRTPASSDTKKVMSLGSAGEPAAALRTQCPPLLPLCLSSRLRGPSAGPHGNTEAPHVFLEGRKEGCRAAPLAAGHLGLYKRNV